LNLKCVILLKLEWSNDNSHEKFFREASKPIEKPELNGDE
jgi:hypothetical protein